MTAVISQKRKTPFHTRVSQIDCCASPISPVPEKASRCTKSALLPSASSARFFAQTTYATDHALFRQDQRDDLDMSEQRAIFRRHVESQHQAFLDRHAEECTMNRRDSTYALKALVVEAARHQKSVKRNAANKPPKQLVGEATLDLEANQYSNTWKLLMEIEQTATHGDADLISQVAPQIGRMHLFSM